MADHAGGRSDLMLRVQPTLSSTSACLGFAAIWGVEGTPGTSEGEFFYFQ